MAFHRCNRFMVGLLLLSLPAALAADTDRLKQSYSEPELHTLAPLGGRVGSSLAVEVRASSWTAPTPPGCGTMPLKLG